MARVPRRSSAATTAAAVAALLVVAAVAYGCTVLVEKFECGGAENESLPPAGSLLRGYCDADAVYLSFAAPLFVLLGWFLMRRTARWAPFVIACAIAAATAVSPVLAAVLWHQG